MKIFYCNINEFDNLNGYELLLPARQEKINACKKEADKLRSLAAGLLTRKILGDCYYKDLSFGKNGKPISSNSSCPFFNLSHSGDYVVFVTSTAPIGVDIELIKSHPPNVARHCYTEGEQMWLNSQENAQAFYQLWSGKESIIKAYGLGFQMSPKTFEILPIRDGAHKINEKLWYLYWHEIDSHQICICSSCEESTFKFIHLKPSDLIQ